MLDGKKDGFWAYYLSKPNSSMGMETIELDWTNFRHFWYNNRTIVAEVGNPQGCAIYRYIERYFDSITKENSFVIFQRIVMKDYVFVTSDKIRLFINFVRRIYGKGAVLTSNDVLMALDALNL